MPKMTVLQMVQDILNDMDSDPVNSITDTTESLQVAQIIKSTFYDIIVDRGWPSTNKLLRLVASGDNDKPTHMSLSDDVILVEWIKYDKSGAGDTRDNFSDVIYLSPRDFVEVLNRKDSAQDNILEINDYSGIVLYIQNDRAPTYWTTFDDKNLVFDSYDNAVDTTLQASKTQVYAEVEPTFTVSNSFIPDLPAKAFPIFLNEAKSACFARLRQSQEPTVERRLRRQHTKIARDKFRLAGGTKYPNYGRK